MSTPYQRWIHNQTPTVNKTVDNEREIKSFDNRDESDILSERGPVKCSSELKK